MNAAAPLQTRAQTQAAKSPPQADSTRAGLSQASRAGGSPHATPAVAQRSARRPDNGQHLGHDFSTMRVLPPVQRKPTLSSPGDAFEREADEVADKVMRRVETGPIDAGQAAIQRKCAVCEQKQKNIPAAASRQGIVGGEEEPSEEEASAPEPATVQLKAAASAPLSSNATGSSPLVDRLARSEAGAESLATGTRRSMETAFGRDFSRVRVHRDGEAALLSQQLNALAFTHGRHVYFGSGQYDPQGSTGKRLLAHELTHGVQQGHAALQSGGGGSAALAAERGTLPAIQRAASWAAAAVNETNSLANTAIDGVPAGVTSPTFNGVQFGALAEPTVNVAAVAAGGFDASVTAVAANVGSVNETVMGPAPWRRAVPQARIRALFPALTQCTGAGNSNFRARGDPSDAAMIAANRRHEDHHATDRRDAFNGSVVPWDARLTAANAAARTFHGATDAAARAALLAAMGGTAAQVMAACLAAGATARDTFHATAAGGPIGAPTDPTAAPDCSWSFARFTNPS